jgi:hypothetical protein
MLTLRSFRSLMTKKLSRKDPRERDKPAAPSGSLRFSLSHIFPCFRSTISETCPKFWSRTVKTIAPLRCWNGTKGSAGLPPHETSFELLMLKTWSKKMTHIQLSSPHKVTSSTHSHPPTVVQSNISGRFQKKHWKNMLPQETVPPDTTTGIHTRINLCWQDVVKGHQPQDPSKQGFHSLDQIHSQSDSRCMDRR